MKIRSPAAASSSMAPRPYTGSVGNATSLPARMRAAARAMLTPAASLWVLVLIVARRLSGLAPYQITVDERFQIALQNAVDVAQRELAPQVLHQAVGRENVVTNLVGEI